MNNNQYINGHIRVILLFVASLLLTPIDLLPDNHMRGMPFASPPSIICPDDIVQANDPGLCSAVVTFTPPANSTLISGSPPGSTFPVGITTNIYMDTVDSTTCSFTITVDDLEPPEVFCPDDINLSYDDGICQEVSYEFPTATDNCGVISLVQISGLPSGSVFPAGTTVNTFEAEDAAGNTATCSFTVTVVGGYAIALKSDGSATQRNAPQGGVRYQRSFFLITPQEMSQSGLSSGMDIDAIGFTIGAPQSDTTEGHLKVYLENTSDTISRIDTNWTTVTSTASHFNLVGVDPGTYEWQVRTQCSGYSDYSESSGFSNDDLDGCNQPYNLEATNTTLTSADLIWESATSSGFTDFLLEFSEFLSDDWDSVYTSDTFYSVSGLTAETNYQWRVKTLCSGENSPVSASSFSTAVPDSCNEPSALSVGTITDSTAEVSWVEAVEASHYEVSVRRNGILEWGSGLSLSENYTIEGLSPGTSYEWRVKSLCTEGAGTYVTGPPFTTTGTEMCYPPRGLRTSGISSSGARLSWLDVPLATSYEIRYRLKESISWDHAKDPMTLVSDGHIVIPDTVGTYFIPFESGSPFTYNGAGIYVALEYLKISGQLPSPNTSMGTKQNTVIKDINGQDSVRLIISFDGNTDSSSTSLPTTLKATNLRPEVRLGTPALSDSVQVAAVYSLGHVAIPYGNPVPVSAFVQNFTGTTKTYAANLTVIDQASGSTRYSESQSISVPANCGEFVNFTGWMPSGKETDSIIVSIPGQPGETMVENNSNHYLQEVNKTFHGYDDGTEAVNGAGFGTGEGLILSKFMMNGCGKVNSASVYLHWSAADNSCYAVLLDSTGTILESSDPFIPDSTEVNEYHSFYFPSVTLLTDEQYYIGLAQTANVSEGYYPVGVQWEGKVIRSGAYYRSDLDGSNLADHPYPGRLMIRAEILPGIPEPHISGSDVLCDGATNTLQAASKTSRWANNVIDYSSEYSNVKFGAEKALGSPDVYPLYNSDPNAWISETSDGQREYIVLGFPDPAPINFIDIYETFNPGAIDTVYIKNDLGAFIPVYADSALAEEPLSKIKQITFDLTAYPVSEIRIALNSPEVSGHNAIDAVSIGQFSDPGTFSTYSWSPGGQTTQSIDITTPGTYVLSVSNGSGCSLTDSIEVTTPSITIPTISADGPTSICDGESVTLTSSEDKNNMWSTGDTTKSITVSTSGTYYVEYSNGCDTATSADVVVTVHPLPVVTIAGGPICPGGSSTLDAGAGYTSYNWSTGATTQTIDVAVPGVYSVDVVDVNGCEGSASIVAFFAPAPVPVIAGDPYYCQGDSTMLDAGPGYASYLWSTGATTRQIYVKTPGVVSVTVTNSYGCTGTATVSTGEYPPPVPFISGTLSLCAGSTTVLDAGAGYSSYLWSTGEITRSIVVDTADTFTVTVTDENGCTGSASVTTTTDGAIPPVPGPIYGPIEGICLATGLEYSIDPIPNTTHYVWTVPDGMTITDGQGTPTITVDVGVLSVGTISVAASNACGQSPTWNGRTLTVFGSPGTPGSITGNDYGVCGLDNVTYSVDAVYGTDTYTWTVPTGATLISGQGSNSIMVSFAASFSSGDICVEVTNDCGTSESSCLTVAGPPGMPGPISGPDEVCDKEKFVDYSIDPVFNAATYTWTVPHQASIVSGQGTSNIQVNFGETSGLVTVLAENSCGFSSLRTLAVTVIKCQGNGSDAIFVDLTNAGWDDYEVLLYGSGYGQAFSPEVIASAGDYNQGPAVSVSWTIGEVVVESAVEDQYLLTQGFQQGFYDVVEIGEDPEGITFGVEVFPVPARDLLNIRITSYSEPSRLKVEMFDMVGNIIYSEEVTKKVFQHQINLSQYATNMFFLKVTDPENNFVKSFKIIKIK